MSAFWRVAHQAKTGDAGLVFMLFPEEIILALQQIQNEPVKVIEVYSVQYSPFNAPNWQWTGQEVTIRVEIILINQKQYLGVVLMWEKAKKLIGFHHLGLIGDKYKGKVAVGETKTMKIYTLRVDPKTRLNKAVLLFDPLYFTQSQMLDYLTKEKNKGLKFW